MKNAQLENIDVRDKIVNHLKDEGRRLNWLSEKTGINYNTLYSILKHKTISLSDGNKAKINEALKTKFK